MCAYQCHHHDRASQVSPNSFITGLRSSLEASFALLQTPGSAAHLSGWTLRLRPMVLRAFPVYLAHSHTQCMLLFSQIFNHILIHTARQIFDPLPGAKMIIYTTHHKSSIT